MNENYATIMICIPESDNYIRNKNYIPGSYNWISIFSFTFLRKLAQHCFECFSEVMFTYLDPKASVPNLIVFNYLAWYRPIKFYIIQNNGRGPTMKFIDLYCQVWIIFFDVYSKNNLFQGVPKMIIFSLHR